MSGKIKSKKTITYGRVEVRAKIPKGDWIWPGENVLLFETVVFATFIKYNFCLPLFTKYR